MTAPNRELVVYVDFGRFEESQVRTWIPQAEAFVEHMAEMLGLRRQ